MVLIFYLMILAECFERNFGRNRRAIRRGGPLRQGGTAAGTDSGIPTDAVFLGGPKLLYTILPHKYFISNDELHIILKRRN